MENRLLNFEYLRKHGQTGKWAQRIIHEMGYMLEISRTENGALDEQLLEQLDYLRKMLDQEGAIAKETALTVESSLSDLSKKAKQYEVTCVSHAHIDMNWLWGFSETASLTVDTFRTMLKLLEEYPQFIFSQSQASTYHIIEQYAPQMLPQICRYVKEGRWELTASSWVENDKNMSGGEAMARHLLYTRKYLSDLFDVSEDQIQVDFEPDTFGHADMLPEILAQGGVKYFYHCRGYDKEHIYNWKAPSGATVLVYREPKWYTLAVEPEMFMHVPSFCAKYGIHDYLKLYGVGDHGGGPTRRDIERIMDMNTWPLFPTIKFGTLHGYFQKLEAIRHQFATVEGELNYVFTGCYTSEARIKRANRIGEDRLYESEVLDSMAKMLCENHHTSSPYEPAWRKILFNQFHDILPGSGITETREHALGEFHNALATANVNANHAMHAICGAIDTASIVPSQTCDTAAGAGVGYGSRDFYGFRFPAAEQGSGTTRVYTLFNPTQHDRQGVFDLMIWDWPEDPSQITVSLMDGTPLQVQVLEGSTEWWGHHYCKLVVRTQVPGLGYQSVVVRHASREDIPTVEYGHPRRDYITDEPMILENEKIRAVFSPNTMQLTSLIRKSNGQELLDPQRPACTFRLITEATATQMTTAAGTEEMSAWRIGRYAAIDPTNETCPVTVTGVVRGPIRQKITFTLPIRNSTILATVSLDAGSDILRFDLLIPWREFGSKAAGVPQLNFHLPLAECTPISQGIVPFGVIQRPALNQDIPCNGLISAMQKETAVSLLADCKYGFRNDGHSLAVTLIRSSYNPDTTPEISNHNICLGIAVSDPGNSELLRINDHFAHPVHACANTMHPGVLPAATRFMEVRHAALSAVKLAEDGNGFIVRVFNPESVPVQAEMTFCKSIIDARHVSATEQDLGQVYPCSDNQVVFEVAPRGISTLRVVL